LKRRWQAPVPATVAPPDSDEDLTVLQVRIDELERLVAEQKATVEADTAVELDLSAQLSRVDAAIEAAAREGALAAGRGDHSATAVAADRERRLRHERDALHASKAAEDRAAQAVELRQSVARLHAETTDSLAALAEEYKQAQAKLPALITELEWNLDLVGLAPERVSTVINQYASRADTMRRAAAANDIALTVPQTPTCRLPALVLNWNAVAHVSRACAVLLGLSAMNEHR
jgi:hypothetical protein